MGRATEVSTRRGATANSIEQKQNQGTNPYSLNGHEAERNDASLRVFWGLGGETVIEFGSADARRIVSAAERHAEGKAEDGPKTAQAEFIAGVLVLEVLRIGLPFLWQLLSLDEGVTTREELFGVLLGEGTLPCYTNICRTLFSRSNIFRVLLFVADSETHEQLETCEAVAQLLRGIVKASAHDGESGQSADEKQREQANIANAAAGGPTRNTQNACCTSPGVIMGPRNIDKSTDVGLVQIWESRDMFHAVATMFLAPEAFYEQQQKYRSRLDRDEYLERELLPVYFERRAEWYPTAFREWLLSSPLIGKYFVEQGYASFRFWRDLDGFVTDLSGEQGCYFDMLQIVLQTPGLGCHDLSTPDGLARMVLDVFRDASEDSHHDDFPDDDSGDDAFSALFPFLRGMEPKLLHDCYKALFSLGARMISSNVANPGDWNWHGAANPLLRVSLLAVQNLGRFRAALFRRVGAWNMPGCQGTPAVQGCDIDAEVQVQHSIFFTEVVSALLEFELEHEREGGLPLFTGASKGAALTVLLALRIAAQRATEWAGVEVGIRKFQTSVAVVKRLAMALVSAGADLSGRLDIGDELRECKAYLGPPHTTGGDGVRLCELRLLPLAAMLKDRELITALEQSGAVKMPWQFSWQYSRAPPLWTKGPIEDRELHEEDDEDEVDGDKTDASESEEEQESSDSHEDDCLHGFKFYTRLYLFARREETRAEIQKNGPAGDQNARKAEQDYVRTSWMNMTEGQRQKYEVLAWSAPASAGGLVNLGNTCFFNAVLQSIRSVEKFVEGLAKVQEACVNPGLHIVEDAENRSQQLAALSALRSEPIFSLSTRIFDSLREGADNSNMSSSSSASRSSSSGGPVNPRSLLNATSKKEPMFGNHMQHDAHEFWLAYVNQLHDALLLGLSLVECRGAELLPTLLFHSELCSRLTCPICAARGEENAWTSEKVEKYRDYSLHFPEQTSTRTDLRLEQLFAAYFEPEQCEYACERCRELAAAGQPQGQRLVTAQKKIRFPAKALALHLKRFKADFQLKKFVKRQEAVHFPEEFFVGEEFLHEDCVAEMAGRRATDGGGQGQLLGENSSLLLDVSAVEKMTEEQQLELALRQSEAETATNTSGLLNTTLDGTGQHGTGTGKRIEDMTEEEQLAYALQASVADAGPEEVEEPFAAAAAHADARRWRPEDGGGQYNKAGIFPIRIKYRISSVVAHLGDTPYSGHYITWNRCWEADTWTCYNDTRASEFDKLPAYVYAQAYMLLYQQVEEQ